MIKYRNKIVLGILLFVIILSGIIIRLNLSTEIINNEPSNPDGLYFQRLAESNIKEDSLRYERTDIIKEIWYKIFPSNIKFFGILTYLLIVIVGLIFLNLDKINDFGSIIYSILISFSTIVLQRLNIGFYDHDVIGMIWLFIIIIFLQLYESKNKIIYLTIIPILIYILKYLWGGLFYISIFLLGIYLCFLMEKKITNKLILRILIFIFFIIISIFLMRDNVGFIEENNTNLFYLYIFLFFSCFLFIEFLNNKNTTLINSLLLFSLIFSFYSIRTTIISFPILFLIISKKIDEFKNNYNKILMSIFIIIVLLFSLVYIPFSSVETNSFSNNEWNDGMNWLKNNTKENSLILSWWDYGYYIQKFGNRKTLMDGGNYNYATNISRFLCSGNYSEIENFNIDYIILFSRDLNIKNSILSFNSNNCNINNNYLKKMINKTTNDEIVYYNNKIIIFKI